MPRKLTTARVEACEPKAATPIRSAACRLVHLIRENAMEGMGRSNDRWRHIRRETLYLAVRAGLHFDLGDIEAFAYSPPSYYSDPFLVCDEDLYTLALIHDNLSAARSFEAWKKRPPFIVDHIEGSASWHTEGHFHVHSTGRLAVGFRFRWEGLLVTVTSFAADGEALVACTHKTARGGSPYAAAKIERRFRITIGELRAEMATRRRALRGNGETTK